MRPIVSDTLLAAIFIPLMILNFAGSIVAGIWLIIIGDWAIFVYGVLASISASFLLGFVLMISLIFAYPAMRFEDKGYRIPALIFGFLSQVVNVVIIFAWCLSIFTLFLKNATAINWIPFAIFSYAVATAPFNFLASKEQENEYTQITLFFIQIAYILLLISFLLLNLTTLYSIYVFVSVMIISIVVLLVIMYSESNKISTRSILDETDFDDELENDSSFKDRDYKILIIHSDTVLLNSLNEELEEYAFQINSANRGEEGLNLVSSNKYDLVILELRLPDMNGEEVLDKIKQHSPSLPVVMMGGHSNGIILDECINKGADDYITQPFEMDDLISKVVDLIIS